MKILIMFILDIIPSKIPKMEMQVLSYFSQRDLSPGALAQVSVGRQKINGLVAGSHSLSKQKMSVKSSSFQMRSISKVISEEPALNAGQMALLKYLSDYYAVPLTLFARTFLPEYLLKKKLSVTLEHISAPENTAEHQSAKSILIKQKTRVEIYKKLIDAQLKADRQILLLSPELAQAQKWQNILRDYSPTLLTSELTPKNYFEEWQKIRNGKTRLIIGTRTAIFANFLDLGLIIIDEEHNPHYKSWDMMPYYHTKTVAFKLAELCGARVALGSEIPSIESYYFAKRGDYEFIAAKKSVTEEKHPTDIIDMRNELFGKNYSVFSYQLQSALENILEDESKKAILFVSRRGNQSFIFCPDCKYMEKCDRCEAHLIFHTVPKRNMICHQCGWQKEPPSLCGKCQSRHIRTFGGGTQKASEEIEKLWGYKNTLVLDYDTASTYKDQQKIIAQFQEEKNKILIGTQALLGKPEMPKADLLAIVSLDNLLYIPDYKIGERIYRLIHGMRAYAKPNARFLFQTYTPENEMLLNILKQDYDDFYQKEISSRKDFNYPPFSDIVKITAKDISERGAKAKARKIADYLERVAQKIGTQIDVLGPSPAYVPRVKNQYIYQVVLKIIKMDEQARTQILKRVAEHAIVDVEPESII